MISNNYIANLVPIADNLTICLYRNDLEYYLLV